MKTNQTEKTEKQIEKLMDEWNRLSLYVSNPEKRMDKIEAKIEVLERQLKLEKLGI